MKYLTAFVLLLGSTTVAIAQAGPVGAPGRYVIVHSPHVQRDTVLLDTATGKTWVLVQDGSLEGDPVYWSPMAREDNPAELQEFVQRHRTKAATQKSN